MAKLRKLAVRVVAGVLIVYALLICYPVRTSTTRAALVILPAILLIGLMAILWRRKWLRWVPMLPPALLGIFLLLPGRPADPRDELMLRLSYVAALQRYVGTRYVWGGEGWWGVDCSGLMRAALVDAHVREAARTFNPALARESLWYWWHDESARDILEGYQGLTHPIGAAMPLREVLTETLEPGDMAVTADGSHVLAYVGEGKWIEADPYVLRVLRLEPGR